MRKKVILVYGIGTNDSEEPVCPRVNGKSVMCPYYRKWSNMLRRCYSEAYHKSHPSYIGCEVWVEWHWFSNFKRWMKTQDWEDKQLDKDLLVVGNKVYSPETCYFINTCVNSMINYPHTESSTLLGVKDSGDSNPNKPFKAAMRVNSKTKHIGYYVTELEAHQAYLVAKVKHITQVAMEQSDEVIKHALLGHALHLREYDTYPCQNTDLV